MILNLNLNRGTSEDENEKCLALKDAANLNHPKKYLAIVILALTFKL